MTLSDYLTLFPGSTREHPRFMALAEAVLAQVTDLQDLAASMQEDYSLSAAAGVQLDRLAEIMGLSRLDTTDGAACSNADFRTYILAKLALWRWNGTNDGIEDALSELPGCKETDNMNGTVSVVTGEALPAEAGKLFPVPAGVRIVTE